MLKGMDATFFWDKGIDVGLTLISVAAGYWLAIRLDRRSRAAQESRRRTELLRELKKSLEQNLKYLDQITDYHFPRNEWPTFNLDTVWLHYFASNVCIEIPDTSKYRDQFNRLRFELDHINNKINLVYVLHPQSEGGALEQATMDVIKATVPHINQAKVWLKEEIDVLTKLVG